MVIRHLATVEGFQHQVQADTICRLGNEQWRAPSEDGKGSPESIKWFSCHKHSGRSEMSKQGAQ